MQQTLAHRRSLWTIAIIVFLMAQGIFGLLFSLSLLATLLAPGRPVIVSGLAILAGPGGGAALVVALASLVIAWGVWVSKPWARQRTLLLEVISVVIGIYEFIEPTINKGAPVARVILAALLLLCLYIDHKR